MYLQTSKYLDEPAHTRRLVDASAFPSVFTLYFVQVRGVFYCICLCFLVSNQTNMKGKEEEKHIFIYVLLKQQFILTYYYG